MIKTNELTDPNSCMSRARDDEMTFVLLGRDAAAPYAIRAWARQRMHLGKNQSDDPQIVEAMACADAIEKTSKLDEMVNRFLAWRLPEDFHPDAGISFNPEYNVEWNAKHGKPPERHKPIGTNLFTATQARAMLEHVLGTQSA